MAAPFEKRDHGAEADLRAEALGLAWLAQAAPQGGVPAVRVLDASRHRLVEERVATAAPTARAAEAAGRALARTHAAGAPWWGAPPPGWTQTQRADGASPARGYWIQGRLTPVVPERPDEEGGWGAFYARVELGPQVQELAVEGFWRQEDLARFDRLFGRLEAGAFDAPEPGLLGHQAPARAHGDLWAGNLLFDADPRNPVGAVLIDPMARGAHAECDLAMLQLFGAPFLGRLLGAYHEVSPLADGWQDRVPLHQLAPLLLHCRLFGTAYRAQTLQALGACL